MSEEKPIRPAATAVVVRDTCDGIEALLLRRHSKSKVGAGAWVFPGGGIEDIDFADQPDDELAAAERAAVRETLEEAAVELDRANLQFISHWTTPKVDQFRKRFATWFFLVPVVSNDVSVDGMEIDRHLWLAPQDAINQHQKGELELMPPTLVTLTELMAAESVSNAMAFYQQREVPWIAPRMASADGVICMLYGGDAGYAESVIVENGPKNRTWLRDGFWEYEFAES